MKRLTFDGNYCDIAQCAETRGGSFCEDGACSQRKVWERLKEWEDLEEQGRVIVMKYPEQDGMARLRELADADRDGRVVVLSEAMEDVSALGDPLEPLKLAAAYKSEELKLIMRRTHSPDSISPLDYTVLAALWEALSARKGKTEEDGHD